MTIHHDLCGGSDLCAELSGASGVTFETVYEGSPQSRHIVATELFSLLADLSPLVAGHMLLLPNRHYLSFAQLVHHHESELTRIISALIPLYRATFGDLTILEHGSSESVDRRACITHAHWHIVPHNTSDVLGQMTHDGLTAIPRALSELATEPWASATYYLASDGNQFHLYEPLPVMPRQYLRSVVGRLQGMRDPEWDYALITRKELLRETMEQTADWDELIGIR